ncbi:MAG: hypothetical protein AAFP18_12360 [Bacteroidota bacterium]
MKRVLLIAMLVFAACDTGNSADEEAVADVSGTWAAAPMEWIDALGQDVGTFMTTFVLTQNGPSVAGTCVTTAGLVGSDAPGSVTGMSTDESLTLTMETPRYDEPFSTVIWSCDVRAEVWRCTHTHSRDTVDVARLP